MEPQPFKVVLTFPNDTAWEVDSNIVIEHRAKYYQKVDNCSYEEAYKDTIDTFSASHYELEDWAQNNMDWKDFSATAQLIEKVEYDYDSEYSSADWHISNRPECVHLQEEVTNVK